MSMLRFRLKGSPGTITYPAFESALRHWQHIIADYDYAFSKSRKGASEWVIAELSANGSLDVVAKRRVDSAGIGVRVSHHTVSGLGQIEREGTTPPYISQAGMKNVQGLVKIIGSGGVAGMVVESETEEEELSAKASVNVDQLLPTSYTSVGSIEGRLEAISLHGKPKYVVYHDRTQRAISCRFQPQDLEEVKAALGLRVNVFGLVHWNPKGEQIKVEEGNLRILGPQELLPTIEEVGGSDPTLTGGRSTADFLREIRGG